MHNNAGTIDISGDLYEKINNRGIVGVKMAPTSHMAQFNTAEKWILLLVYVNRFLVDTTKARRHDGAMYLLSTNRNL